MEFDSYTWVFALSTIFSFMCAFGIGANDMANSFAPSVGAKALTIGQAVMIASVMEFSGAVALGSGVTSTIKNGITDVKFFQTTPDLFMFGMFCVLIAAAIWDNLSCRLELPVSTTHTAVSAIIGMTVTLRGSDAVVWSRSKDEFPYFEGATAIFASWIASPLASLITVTILFGIIRTFILRSENSFQRGYFVLPLFVFLTFFIISLFVIQTGNKNASWDEVNSKKASWISIVVAVPLSAFTYVAIMPFIRNQVIKEDKERQEKLTEEGTLNALRDVETTTSSWWNTTYEKFANFCDNNLIGRIIFRNPIVNLFSYGVSEDIHEEVKNNQSVAKVWENAEVFDWKTEALFRYLQVFSASVMSFAHGANEVGNAVGPYAAVYYVWRNRKVPGSKSPVPMWIYLMGGVGLACGLAIYGHHIMRVLGVKVAKLTNARGFCVELSTAIVVLIASRYGLPVSTTHIVTGAILAIGLFEGFKGVNWFIIGRTCVGWVITLIIASFVSSGFVAFATYAPSKVQSDNIVAINKILLSEVVSMRAQLNAYNVGSNFSDVLNTTINNIAANFTPLNGTTDGYINPILIVQLQENTLKAFNETFVV